MPAASDIDPTPSGSCRACGKRLPQGRSVCPACGAAHGEANRCPHCQAIADVEPHPSLGFRCRVCGGPRLPLDAAGAQLGEAARAALHSAGKEHGKHALFSAAGFALLGMGALGLLVAMVAILATSPGLLPTLAALLACTVPLGAGVAGLLRAATARRERDEALHSARLAALEDLQAVTGPLDATRAAELLRIDAERAELLLAEVSVANLLEGAAAPRVRVDAGPASMAEEATSEPLAEPAARTQRGDTEG